MEGSFRHGCTRQPRLKLSGLILISDHYDKGVESSIRAVNKAKVRDGIANLDIPERNQGLTGSLAV
jgi:hypothetical protein